MSERLLTVNEAAEYLRLAPEVVRRKVRNGQLRAHYLPGGRSIRFTRTDLDDQIARETKRVNAQ